MVGLAVVIVSWNVRELLRRCLDSVYSSMPSKAADIALEVVVVDNGSSDGSFEMVQRCFPQVRLIVNDNNPGFSAANNQALETIGLIKGGQEAGSSLEGKGSGARYVLFLNPDTEIVGPALSTMVEYMEANPEVGVVGPRLLNPDGSEQSSRRRFPTMATAFLESTILQQWFPDNPVLRHYYLADGSPQELQEVDWVTGACFMVRDEALTQVGYFDESFFMYFEELDWCYRCKSQGWKVVYLPEAKVIHYGGQSSQQVLPYQHIHFQSSKVTFFRKHYGPRQAEILRLFLLATYLYQLVLEGLKGLVGHKRQLRWERVAAYRQVLRSGLRGVPADTLAGAQRQSG
ncbi:MAG: glycosyltransferase family 2 protein [Anaerolineae bacterium]